MKAPKGWMEGSVLSLELLQRIMRARDNVRDLDPEVSDALDGSISLCMRPLRHRKPGDVLNEDVVALGNYLLAAGEDQAADAFNGERDDGRAAVKRAEALLAVAVEVEVLHLGVEVFHDSVESTGKGGSK